MYLGIDCGTQGTKAILWHEGKILSSAYTHHQLNLDNKGKREQSPQWWIDAMLASITKALSGFEEYRKAIKGIGISGQQHGLVLLDRNDQVICDALLWCDTRPVEELKDFERMCNINFPQQLGIQVPVAFTLAKLLWIKQHDPQSFSRIHKIMLPHDYLNFYLTGRYAVEPGDASGTGWFNTVTKTIDSDILDLLELPDSFQQPSVVDSQSVFGYVRAQVCAKLGLSSKVIVSSGGGDNMMAAIGTGNVDEGTLTISLGTSGTVFGHSHQQIDTAQFPDLNAFCSSSNGYLPLASTMNVTTANNQILDLINKDISNFDQLLNSAKVGSGGLLSLPFYNGARLPNVPSAKGAVLGMTASNVSQHNIMRATVEGVTYNLARGIDVLRQSGVKFDQACIIGGGANSRAWRQLIADVTNLSLVVPTSTEAAAVGGAIQAFWAYESSITNSLSIADLCRDFVQFDPASTIQPNRDNHQQYSELTKNYYHLVDQYMKSSFY